jgi:putative transposase
MTLKRRQHSGQSKAMIALEAVKERKTVKELAAEYGIHPPQISQWKRQLLEGLPELFSSRRGKRAREAEALQEELYQEIGRLKMELEWVKKKLPSSTTEKRVLIEWGHPEYSLRRQCELWGLSRSGLYYVPAHETDDNLRLMRLIDEQ